MADLKVLADAVIKGDQATAVELVKQAVEEKMPSRQILEEGLISAMAIVGDRFSKNEIYIPEMLIAARAMKSAVEILEPVLVKDGVEPVGKFMIGTVAGDLHDIGKNLVAMMMKGAGFTPGCTESLPMPQSITSERDVATTTNRLRITGIISKAVRPHRSVTITVSNCETISKKPPVH